jgi:hypothetical protein
MTMKKADEWLKDLGDKTPTLEQVVALQQEAFDKGVESLETLLEDFIDGFNETMPKDPKDMPGRPQ